MESWNELFINCTGQIFYKELYRDKKYVLTRLKVMPYSSILLHSHTVDCEYYIDEDTNEVYFCPKGGSHCYINSSYYIKSLLSVKIVM